MGDTSAGTEPRLWRVAWKSGLYDVTVCAEKLCLDTLMLRTGVHRFLHLDFVGAPWWWCGANEWCSHGGNGGFSLRSRDVMLHVLRNSMIPVVTVIALNLPSIFGGAIITEQIFKVNGIGQQLIGAIYANDLPTIQTLTFIFAVLIVFFNLLADIIYGLLDPRIRYD